MNINQIHKYDIGHEFFITANKQLHNEKITAMLKSIRTNNGRKELVFSFPIPNKVFQNFLFPKDLAFYTSNIHVKPIENSKTESLLVFSIIEVDNVSEHLTFINVQTKTGSNEINNPIDPDILLHRKTHIEEDAITLYYKAYNKPSTQQEITSHSFTANKNNILEFKTLTWLSVTNNDFNQVYYNLKEFIENNYIILKIANLTGENKIDKDYNIKLELARSYSYQENTYLPLETDQTLNNSSRPNDHLNTAGKTIIETIQTIKKIHTSIQNPNEFSHGNKRYRYLDLVEQKGLTILDYTDIFYNYIDNNISHSGICSVSYRNINKYIYENTSSSARPYKNLKEILEYMLYLVHLYKQHIPYMEDMPLCKRILDNLKKTIEIYEGQQPEQQPQQNNEPNHPKPSRFYKDKHVYFYDPESSFPNHCYGKIKNVIYQNESYYYEILIRPNYTIPVKENKVFMSTPELDITDETIITIRKPIFSLPKGDYTIKQLRYLIGPFIALSNNNHFYAFIYVLQNFIGNNEQ